MHMQFMTDQTNQHQPVNAPAVKNNPWLEFGPVIVFFIVYIYLRRTLPDPNTAIYPAAGVLAVLSAISLIYSKIRHGRMSGVLILTTAIVCLSAGLAYIFKDPRFFYMKPTVINILFGVAVIGGVAVKKNVIQLMFGEAFDLPIKAWNQLAIRWGLFFFVLAGLNELVWRNFEEPTWVKFKLFGLIPLTIIFTMTQLPFIMKHGTVKGQEPKA